MGTNRHMGLKGMTLKELAGFLDTCRRVIANPKSKEFSRDMATQKLREAEGEINRRTSGNTGVSRHESA